MNQERLRQIEELYRTAREDRAALDQADPELRREVELLLEQDGVSLPSSNLATESTVTQVTVGAQLGPYKIEARIGAGGMGEVYRAVDTRLKRTVAIKVTKENFGARFEREARAIAALNHPNICTLYDVGPNYLVMELIEGKPLKGPLALDQALQYAAQICDALDAAHRKAITHRDLKPGNILVTKQGVKLLDFGLARMAPGENDPTLTRPGVVMGTPAYMAPEQREGKPGDACSDIYAFGCVLYEMLTGKRVGQERTPVEPAALEGVLGTCLEKDPEDRWQSARDLKRALEWVVGQAPAPPVRAGLNRLPWVLAALAAVVALVLGWVAWRATRPVDRPLMRFTDDLGAEISLASNSGPAVAISPDGLRLAYISRDSGGNTHLLVRLIGSAKSTMLAGTEGASAPFFSPDGQWIAFFADQKLKKISLDGAAVILCDVPNPRGGAWGDDDNILFAANPRAPLSRISSSGGTPQQATEFDKQKGEATHRFPQTLPGGEAFLFTSSRDNNNYDAATVEVQSVKTGQRKTLIQGYFGRYLPGGYLIYFHGTTLFAAPMDLKRLQLTGPASPVLEDVSGNAGALAQLNFTPSGTVVYVAGSQSQQSLSWLDALGNSERLPVESGLYSYPRASPDGMRIAVRVSQSSGTNLAVYEWAANRMTPVTFLKGGVGTHPTWTPDSKHLIFPLDSQELSGPGIYWMRTDGVGEPRRLLESQNLATYSVSPDGKRLAYFRQVPDYEIGTIPLDLADPEHPKAGKPEPYLVSKSDVRVPAFSPDGRWMAYVSSESGPPELYVRPFPGTPSGSGKWKISTGGISGMPYWSRKRNELFYQAIDGRIWIASYTVKSESFAGDKPRLWSEKAPAIQINQLTLMPDGKRFVALMSPSATEKQTHVTFLLNFFDELRRRVPPGGK